MLFSKGPQRHTESRKDLLVSPEYLHHLPSVNLVFRREVLLQCSLRNPLEERILGAKNGSWRKRCGKGERNSLDAKKGRGEMSKRILKQVCQVRRPRSK